MAEKEIGTKMRRSEKEMQEESDLLGGWSHEDILSSLSPEKTTNSTSINEKNNNPLVLAGWSPQSLSSALIQSPQVGTKRSNHLRTPENFTYSSSISHERKLIDLKDTPPPPPSSSAAAVLFNETATIISLLTPQSEEGEGEREEEEQFKDLSQVFAEHSISYTSPKKPFQSARRCFEESLQKVSFAESINLDNPLPNGWSLYPFQKTTIRRCLSQERSILALDMGLGKIVFLCLIVDVCYCT